MKLIDVKNETAVTRILTYVRICEKYLSLTGTAIKSDMSPFDACNMISLKKWFAMQDEKDGTPFRISFCLQGKRGQEIWTANCRLASDYYHIAVENVSFRLTKHAIPDFGGFGIEYEFGFVSFCAVPDSFRAIELLHGYVDQVDILFRDVRNAHELAESNAVKVSELESELEDLKQQLADIYWSTQN